MEAVDAWRSRNSVKAYGPAPCAHVCSARLQIGLVAGGPRRHRDRQS